MTERLYYKDPNILKFESEIIGSTIVKDKSHTILHSSAFYPTSGGQLFDRGTINEIEIEDVIESADGEVVHISSQEIGKTGTKVTGEVDRKRRWDNRQKHSAQHIISQSLIRLYEMETVSVHLGEEYSAVELNVSSISDEALSKVEEYCNQLILENLPIEIIIADSSELSKYPLRKIPERIGAIRIIRIGEFDYSACGGTHCNSTAEIQLVKFIGVEKIRKNIQIKFLSGIQAIEDYSNRYNITSHLSKTMTCSVDALAGNISKLIDENSRNRKLLSSMLKEQIPQLAKNLSDNLEKINETTLVCSEVNIADIKMLSQLASETAKHIDGLVFLIQDDKIALASSNDKLRAGEIAKALSQKTSLKGGGNDKTASLGGAEISKLNEYKNYVREIIEQN